MCVLQRLVPFDTCISLRQMQSKYALASTCQARLTNVNGTIYCPGTRAPGGPGSGPLKSRVTRWQVRVRSPKFGGYPFVAGTRWVAPLLCDNCCRVHRTPYTVIACNLACTPSIRQACLAYPTARIRTRTPDSNTCITIHV